MKGFCCTFFCYALYAKVRKIIPDLILHAIINLYQGKAVYFQILFFNVNHHKSFGSGLTAVNEVRNNIVLYLTIYIYCADS